MTEVANPERIERHVYDGRIFLGFYHSRQTGNGFDAVDAAGKFLGRFDTTDAAALAIIFAAKAARAAA
jgi:hypothetical protein